MRRPEKYQPGTKNLYWLNGPQDHKHKQNQERKPFLGSNTIQERDRAKYLYKHEDTIILPAVIGL